MKKLFLLCLLLATISMTAQRRGKLKNTYEKNGNIGIGTKSPDQLLTVKGKIHTQEVIVDLKGAVAPDYVFDHYFEGESILKSDYSMMTLLDLAIFIEKYHHLPGIPSAEEIKEDGLALKEMNLLLLEKVEELTLYVLQQQKEINVLKELISKD